MHTIKMSWLLVVAMSLLTGLAQAQSQQATEISDPKQAERLACLVRTETLALPTGVTLRAGLVRAKLRFEAADQAPQVELLLAQQVDAVHLAAAQDFLRSYRLPCLKPGDAIVEAVQEIAFDGGIPPLPWIHETAVNSARSCVLPSADRDALGRGLGIGRISSRALIDVLVVARFDAGPDEPPVVESLTIRGARGLEKSMRAYLRGYRMPCRVAGDKPHHFEQSFRMMIDRNQSFSWPKEPVSLQRFLGMSKNREQLSARFDFDTMGCPFTLHIATRRPALPNRVRQSGPPNPNRAALLAWLATMEPSYETPEQTAELFNQEITVQVPCGRLDLQPAAVTAATPAPSP